MDVNVASSAISANAQAKTGDAVALLVMRKAIDAQEKGAVQLVEAVAQTAKTAPTGNVGKNVNAFA